MTGVCTIIMSSQSTPAPNSGLSAMQTVSIQEAQSTLRELIHRLSPNEEVVITEDDRPVARLVAAPSVSTTRMPRQLGTLKGTVLYMAPDFDAPLDEFQEFME